jgi:predicted O-methyltransferase YrrM
MSVAENPRARLLGLIVAFRQTQCIRVAADLGVADHLVDGPASSSDLAAACGAKEPYLRRLLRALVALGLLDQDDDGRYRLTAVGEQLSVGGLGAAAQFYGRDPTWSAWRALDHAVRTGESPFDHAHGMPLWDYYARHPETAATFDAAMASITGGLTDAVVSAYDFSGFRRVVDVGGGDGTLLAGILHRCPDTRGVLFDRDHVVDRARSALDAAGVGERCELVGGDFRDAVPGGGDCYVLKWILHDWDDEACATILRRCREAVDPGGRLVVVERVLPERVGPADLDAVLSDLNMMVMVSGRERTETEFAELFAGAGFRLELVSPTGTNLQVIEAVPV